MPIQPGPCGGPVVLPADQVVGAPGESEQFTECLGAGGQRLDGGLVGGQELVARGGLRGDLLLPLGGGGGDLLAEHLVRVGRGAPGAGGEPGLQVLHRDAVLDAAGLGRGAREAAVRQEQPGVVRGHRLRGPVQQTVVGPVLLVLLIPVGRVRVGVAAVQRVAQVLDRLDAGLVGLRGRVTVEVVLALPELLPDPPGDAGLLEEVKAVVAARPGWPLEVCDRLEAAGRRQTGDLEVPDVVVESGVLLACGVPVLLERRRQRGGGPVLPVRHGVQFVRRLVQSVLGDAEHGRAAHPQDLAQSALVLAELLGGLGVETVVAVTAVRGVGHGSHVVARVPADQIRLNGHRTDQRHGDGGCQQRCEKPGACTGMREEPISRHGGLSSPWRRCSPGRRSTRPAAEWSAPCGAAFTLGIHVGCRTRVSRVTCEQRVKAGQDGAGAAGHDEGPAAGAAGPSPTWGCLPEEASGDGGNRTRVQRCRTRASPCAVRCDFLGPGDHANKSPTGPVTV